MAEGQLSQRFLAVRKQTDALCAGLTPEDCVVQSMPDASPTKWHLAHTSWFFETFVLSKAPSHRVFDPSFGYLFNSYYESLGPRHPRSARGLLTRPSLDRVLCYRAHVTEAVAALLARSGGDADELAPLIELGIQHEQQHQELILTDIKHLFSLNAGLPAYHDATEPTSQATLALGWRHHDAGVRLLGHRGAGFCFDNEGPAHRVFIEPFAIANRLVTNGEYRQFMRDGGYSRPELWLADGFRASSERGWVSPLYWDDAAEHVYTLSGLRPIWDAEPVCHVSFYEADAFARWASARLPTEAEWELTAGDLAIAGNFLESGRLHPLAAPAPGDLTTQMFGDVWEWTSSAYCPYPGYRPTAGTLGEYNGKFMSNQMVLRGGSCVTPLAHIRASYRNFFPPDARWQFSGFRLARSA
ncbi:MAG: ergothioneine biosynthesis protein EgtB [Polyangiales bacterium]